MKLSTGLDTAGFKGAAVLSVTSVVVRDKSNGSSLAGASKTSCVSCSHTCSRGFVRLGYVSRSEPEDKFPSRVEQTVVSRRRL